MEHGKDAVVTIVSLIIGIAALSVILSPKATTANVIQAFSSGLANNIAVAQSPVTGNPVSIITNYPTGGSGYNVGSSLYG